MKARDPNNPDELIDISVADGDWYTEACTNPECGFENGVLIVNERTPRFLFERRPCIQCNSATVWKPLDEINSTTPEDAKE